MSNALIQPHDCLAISAWAQLGQTIVQLALQAGASGAELSLGFAKGFDLTVRGGDIETLSFNRDIDLVLTLYKGQRVGVVQVSDLQLESVQQAIEKALHIATYTDADPFAGLADISDLAQGVHDLNLYHPWALSPEQAKDKLIEIEREALAFDPRIKASEGVSLATHEGLVLYANSLGFVGAYPKTSHSLSCQLRGELEGEMQTEGDYTLARDPADLWSGHSLAKRAAAKTVAALGPRSIKTGAYPVIFRSDIATSLVKHLVQGLSGQAVYHRATYLADTLGKLIIAPHLSLIEDPLLPKGIASAPFDGDGVATRRQAFIEKGQCQSYILSSYSARQLGLKTTGNAGGVRNLRLSSTQTQSFEQLLKTLDKGLLITGLMGQGVNIVTGDYSRGANGFWIEGGEIAYPVEGITVASDLDKIGRSITHVGDDLEDRASLQTGSLLVSEMQIGGH